MVDWQLRVISRKIQHQESFNGAFGESRFRRKILEKVVNVTYWDRVSG